jgi:hypothetical protein
MKTSTYENQQRGHQGNQYAHFGAGESPAQKNVQRDGK